MAIEQRRRGKPPAGPVRYVGSQHRMSARLYPELYDALAMYRQQRMEHGQEASDTALVRDALELLLGQAGVAIAPQQAPAISPFDVEVYQLGKLCKNANAWPGTAQSLRSRHTKDKDCVECKRGRDARYQNR